MKWFLYNEVNDLPNDKWAQIILQALDYMSRNMGDWLFQREQQSLWYMTYLTEVIKKVDGPTLKTMKKYVLLIKPGSFYHLRIYQLKELHKCSHPVNADPPKPDLEPPSMTSLKTHKQPGRSKGLILRPLERSGISMLMLSNCTTDMQLPPP